MIQYDIKTGAAVREIDSDILRPLVTDKRLPTAVLDAEKQYYSFRDQHGNVPYWPDDSCEWVVKDKLIKVTAYNKETKQPKEFDDESLIDDEYTTLEPVDNSIWVKSEWVVQSDLVAESNRIKAKTTRDNAVSSNITVHNAEWQVLNDAEDIRKAIGDAETINASEEDSTIFRLADNSWRETTLSELRDVLKAHIARKQDVWNQMAVWDSSDKQESFEVK